MKIDRSSAEPLTAVRTAFKEDPTATNRIAAIERSLATGATWNEIAARAGLSRQGVADWYHRNRGRRQPDLHPDQVAKLNWLKACRQNSIQVLDGLAGKLKVIADARAAGRSWAEIGDALDWNYDNHGTLDRWYDEQSDVASAIRDELVDDVCFDHTFDALHDEMREEAIAHELADQ